MKTVDDVAHDLQGTCLTLNQVLERNNLQVLQDDVEFLSELDQLIFCCTVCGWWCEISEECSTDHDLEELTCLDCVG